MTNQTAFKEEIETNIIAIIKREETYLEGAKQRKKVLSNLYFKKKEEEIRSAKERLVDIEIQAIKRNLKEFKRLKELCEK